MPATTKRTHVIIPENLVHAIDSLVGKRGRSAFITDAATRELERRHLLEALEQAAGTWSDKDHPELKHGAEAWVRKQRRLDEARDKERRGNLPR